MPLPIRRAKVSDALAMAQTHDGTAGVNAPGPPARRRHTMGLGISVRPQVQGQGVGSALMAALCDYADRWVGMLRLELTFDTDNHAAIHPYRKFGFEVEATMRSYALPDGAYAVAPAMARLHLDPPTLAAR